MATSTRAKWIWNRLASWYGTRLADQYGPQCPADWCRVIDRADRDVLRDALVEIRRASPIHPPTLGQLEAAIRKFAPPKVAVDYRDRLMDAVLRHPLTPRQLSGGWTWYAQEVANQDGRQVRVIAGVEVPADGDAPAVRVTIRDLGIETVGVAA